MDPMRGSTGRRDRSASISGIGSWESYRDAPPFLITKATMSHWRIVVTATRMESTAVRHNMMKASDRRRSIEK